LKVAIFAGGKGSRLIEETRVRPKPLVEVGNRPILWHIMQHYSAYNHNEFVLALGYMGDLIKRYISELCQYNGNFRIDFNTREMFGEPDGQPAEYVPYPPWVVDLIDTGVDTMTGGRLARLEPYLGGETFMLTKAIEAVNGDDIMWEEGPLPKLMEMGELMAYRHPGFWYCMDHLADKRRLEDMWKSGDRPWATWENRTCAIDGPSGVLGDGRSAGIGRGGHPGDWVRYKSI